MAKITQHFRVHYTTVSRLVNEYEAIRLGEMATFHFIATSVEELVRVGTYPGGAIPLGLSHRVRLYRRESIKLATGEEFDDLLGRVTLRADSDVDPRQDETVVGLVGLLS